MLDPRAIALVKEWREVMLRLARSLRTIPDLPPDLVEAARALEQVHEILDADGLVGAPEALNGLWTLEGELARKALVSLAGIHATEALGRLAEAVRGADEPRAERGAGAVIPFPGRDVPGS